MDADRARDLARHLFLDDDNVYGCAETSYVVLKHALGLPDPDDSSAAMALNGGIAYSGGTCGAITGAALAIGQLAEGRIEDHGEAKRTARRIIMELMDEFAAEYGATDCRRLIDYDLRAPGEHERFIESGVWRTGCMRQVEFAVGRLAALGAPEVWEASLAAGG